MRRSASRTACVLALAVVVSVSGLGVALTVAVPTASSPRAAPASASLSAEATTASAAGSTTPAAVQKVQAIEEGLRAKGIDPTHIHLPNFLNAVTQIHQQVAPSYVDAPAPMGVADIGLRNDSGTLTPYELNTTSVAGTVNITNLQSLYVDGDGPNTYGIQLNSVAANVTVFGNDTYQYWSQNYVDYTPSTQQLVFGDEVWNFSNASGYFPANSVYEFSPNGTTADFPYLYQGYGPAITVGYPFSLTMYLNTTVIDDRPAFYFNYSVTNATFHQAASFDWLIFNSTVGTPTAPALTPQYQSDGYQYDPIGLINDMEIDLLGNDDGDTTAFYEANATVNLQFWNETADQMETVPSAYNAGEETGETSVGLLVYSSGGTHPIAEVRSGPAFVGGLWNYSGASGAVAVTVHLHPTNSFIFVNPGGTEKTKQAQWVPSPAVSPTTFYLPSHGTFYLDFLLSDHDPVARSLTLDGSPRTLTEDLALDRSQGIYTPLFALNNSELGAISSSGTGTAADPYVLDNNQVGPLDAVFAQWDDYLFPVFPGLLLANTTAFVDVTPPSFLINIPAFEFTAPYVPGFTAGLGLPTSNDLGINFYDASDISLVDGTGISGWMSLFQTEYPESAVLVWGCENVLIASNTFEDQGGAILLYGGSGNTIWGNTFVSGTIDTTSLGSIDDSGANVTGVNESESGDLIYDNAFEVPLSALTDPFDPFLCAQFGECGFVPYADAWNVSRQPLTDQRVVNGFILTGSIVDTNYQGGNYWTSYSGGPLPFTDNGLILTGGDYVPLVPEVTFVVTFSASGLPAGDNWSVSVAGMTQGSTTSTIEIPLADGTYAVAVSGPSGYVVIASPTVTVDGAPTSFDVTFAVGVPLTITATGLSIGAEWTATITGAGTDNLPQSSSSDTPTVTFDVAAGSYTASFVATGYTPSPASEPVQVGSSGATASVAFTLLPGSLKLAVLPVAAHAWVDGTPVVLANGAVTASVAAGVAAVEVSATGYETYFNNVSVPSQGTGYLNVTLTSTPTTSSGPGLLFEGLVVLLGILAVVFLVGMIYYARRASSRPGAPSPPPAQEWKSAPPPKEWDESQPPASPPPSQ